MKKVLQLFFVILLFAQFNLFSQVPVVQQIINSVNQDSIIHFVKELTGVVPTMINGTSQTILSRHKNQPGNELAENYIRQKLQYYGLATTIQSFSSTGKNVIGTKTGTEFPNKKFIICAHYDDMPSGPIAPGADDNGSGTAAVIEAARILSQHSFPYTVIFALWDEEEQGLIGSRAYADSSYNRGDSIKGVLNFDMIAWDSNNDFKMNMYSNSASYNFSMLAHYSFNVYQPVMQITFSVGNMSSSDHYYFWQRGYNAFCGIELMTDFHPYYHTINDNFANIKMPYFLKFTQASLAALMTFAWNYTISFNHTPITASSDTGPRTASVVITSPYKLKKLTYGPRLYYRVNSGSFNALNFNYNNLDTFRFTIPGQAQGSLVEYYFAAQDSLANFVGTYPLGGRGLNPPGTTAPSSYLQYQVLTGVQTNNQPAEFSLSQNYPNPFNPMTNIEFYLPKYANVKIIVNDLLGREVVELANLNYSAGRHTVSFEGKNYPSGIYFYTMYLDGAKFETKKMILIK